MTYEHLAGRLIETQRSMLGESAIDIARSVENVSVTDDGTVTALDGDGREVVDELVRKYVDVLGTPAENRLSSAAREFESELVLPPALGGPEEVAPDPTDDRPARHGPAAAPGASGAVSDGGTLTLHSPTPEHTTEFSSTVEPREETGIEQEPADAETEPATEEASDSGGATESEDTGDATESEDAGDAEAAEDSPSGPLIVRYSVATDLDSVDRTTTDLESVYLLPTGESGWQAPVSVADAVVSAVSERTDLDDAALYELTDSVDSERLVATLAGVAGETVSFHQSDVTVTFHRSGSLAVH